MRPLYGDEQDIQQRAQQHEQAVREARAEVDEIYTQLTEDAPTTNESEQ